MAMLLNDEQQAMRQGALGEPLRWAIEQQIQVGELFGAARFVPVASAQVGAEIGTMGEAGLRVVESLVHGGAFVRVPTVTAACSVDFQRSCAYGVPRSQVDAESRLHTALRAMGCMDTSTCINYQTVSPPRFRQHVAWGDTGAVTFANGVVGARSNYEAGPASIAAALTGVVPEYGFHLPEHRIATRVFEVDTPLVGTADWSALGALVGSEIADYWTVPAIVAEGSTASIDDLKHFAAAVASFGSVAMFHVVGATPEASTLDEACGGQVPAEVRRVTRSDLRVGSRADFSQVDLVVFSAPQLSLQEAVQVVRLLDGQRVAQGTRLIMTVNAQVESELTRLGFLKQLQDAGGELITGTCFYVMAPVLVRQTLGAKTLLTPSAKLMNILGGAGYDVGLASVEACVEAAVRGRLP
ncbi:aconitase X catalytic domain-containing protein [Hydrogenophaga sp. 2FB]|uniref:aconitase X catalytic domain-containing protein n=1 Tax=Hydrogenophaga sp. 2FB TaxID=2502187 RepID=UPI0010F5F842|nr:aconitase X catalytic domain-containing protein [Hydrogenophaga sp. 2FB]